MEPTSITLTTAQALDVYRALVLARTVLDEEEARARRIVGDPPAASLVARTRRLAAAHDDAHDAAVVLADALMPVVATQLLQQAMARRQT